MKLLTENAVLVCQHETGRVQISPSQGFVRISGRRVLVRADPERRPIKRCSNRGPTIKPCQLTLTGKGYSNLVYIGGKQAALDTVTGVTDGTPPGAIKYIVRNPGQQLVNEA